MSTIDNPEIDRLIARGDLAAALQQPIRHSQAQGRTLDSMMLGPKISEAAKDERNASREHEIGEDRTDNRRPNHVVKAGSERDERDDHLRCIAKGCVEQAANGVAGVCGQVLGG